MTRSVSHRHAPGDEEWSEPAAYRASRTGNYAPAFVRKSKCRRCGRTIALVPAAPNRQAYWRAA